MLPLIDCDNVCEVLDELNPTLWSWNSEAVKAMRSNSYKQINRILVHHDAILWHEYHSDEFQSSDFTEWELDDNGVLITEFTCRIDYDEQVSDVVLSYYGTRLDYERYDY